MNQSILWRGLHLRGHEACRLYQVNTDWHLEGTAVFTSENRTYRLSYLVICDAAWKTQKGFVSGWVGNDNLDVDLSVDALQHWRMNGVEQPAVSGCVDLDLNFSPSTNLLPIRRLNLGVGEHGEVKAAWLRFPSFELEPLTQVYTRLDESTYRYSSGGGRFVCDLTVNEAGLVTDYPGLWQAEQ